MKKRGAFFLGRGNFFFISWKLELGIGLEISGVAGSSSFAAVDKCDDAQAFFPLLLLLPSSLAYIPSGGIHQSIANLTTIFSTNQ